MLFIVRPEADRKMHCATCGSPMRAGERGKAVTMDGYVEHQHQGACPVRKSWNDRPEERVIQGAQ